MVERQLVFDNLLGKFHPFIAYIVANEHGHYHDPLVRETALLALCRYMCVSNTLCEQYLPLLFTALEKENENDVHKGSGSAANRTTCMIGMSVFPVVCMSIYLSIFLSISLYICLSICTSVLTPSYHFSNLSHHYIYALPCLTLCYHVLSALGDLAFRFPNALEPWTSRMYARLSDTDTGVRYNTLMVLTHLILNDMVKVKGQVGRGR